MKLYRSSIEFRSKFAGPCAQGVWDPVIIPRPMSRAVLFVPSTLSWASLGPLDPKVCSSTATRRILGGSWRLLGGLSLWVATFCTLKKRRVLPFDLRLGGARTDQGPQHTHHIPQLIVPWPYFSPHALFFDIFLKKASLNIPYTRVIYRTLE